MNEIGWMANFGFIRYDPQPPRIGQVEITHRTAKMCKLAKRCDASGYRAQVPASEVYSTRELLIAAIRGKCLELAKRHRETAVAFEKALEAL